jgi:hypothetical protein
MLQAAGSAVSPSKHTGKFPDTRFRIKTLNPGAGLFLIHFFFDTELRHGERGHLWQMGDTQYLAAPGHILQSLPHRRSRLSADPGIDFIKNNGAKGVGTGRGLAQCQHNA